MLKKTAIFILLILLGIQFIEIDKSAPAIDETLTLQAPQEIMALLKQSCYDCHSFETRWPYYSSIAPVSFFMASHVKNGRNALNFSLWSAMDEKIKAQRLQRAVETVNNERMALPSYISAHEEAKLNKEEKITLTNWFKSELKTVNEKK